MGIRITRGSAPGTGISLAHSSGTALNPMLRAATAGNSASRSSVSVKMQLTTLEASSSLRLRISRSSHSVAPRIAWGSFWSTVVAPRRACSRMGAASYGGLRRPRLRLPPRHSQRLDLRLGQAAIGTGLEAAEAQRPERDALERGHRMADRLAHPAHLALAPLAQRQLEHSGPWLAHLSRARPPVVEFDPLAQGMQRARRD